MRQTFRYAHRSVARRELTRQTFRYDRRSIARNVRMFQESNHVRKGVASNLGDGPNQMEQLNRLEAGDVVGMEERIRVLFYGAGVSYKKPTPWGNNPNPR